MADVAAEAVLFFENSEIEREMTFSEYQAILDGYVPLTNLSLQTVKAVYVRINHQFHVTAAVFFKLPFDKSGFIEKTWNIPVEQLADQASRGPDMGAGAIRLVCYSQCPVAWHQKGLWDPQLKADSNDFAKIKRAIKSNRLGLVMPAQEVVDTIETNYLQAEAHQSTDDERLKAAMLIKEQRLKYKLAIAQSQQDIRELNIQHQQRVLDYQQKLSVQQQQLSDALEDITRLKEELVSKDEKLAGVREYFENKILEVSQRENMELTELRSQYEEEVQLRVETSLSELRSELESRRVELLYRTERESKLQEEILNLQKEKRELSTRADGDSSTLLKRLDQAGIDFVTYHPGIGYLSIPIEGVDDFLDNAHGYIAKQCGVNEHLYKAWLDHYYSPTCQHVKEDGSYCDAPLHRIEDPSEFIVGEHDRCATHMESSSSVVNIKNGRKAQRCSINKTSL